MARNSYRSFLVISVTYISVMATAASFEWNYLASTKVPEADKGNVVLSDGRLGSGASRATRHWPTPK